jgi:phage gp36-like protein
MKAVAHQFCKKRRIYFLLANRRDDARRHFELLTQFQAKVVDASALCGLTSRQKWEAMDQAQKILTIQIAMKVWLRD